MVWSSEKLNDVYLQMQNLATTDIKFRAELLVNANAAIEKHIGESLPEDYKVKAIEQDPDYTVTLVLPPMVNELNEDDLEDVAGGGNYESPNVADIGDGERVIPALAVGAVKAVKAVAGTASVKAAAKGVGGGAVVGATTAVAGRAMSSP